MTDEDAAFETNAIHAGYSPDPETGAVMPPIHPSSTFVQNKPGEPGDYEYARTGNPTRSILEESLATLEGAAHGRAFASGMAAIDAVLHLLDPGDRVVVSQDVYGGTHRLFTQIYDDYGFEFEFINMDDMAAIETALTPETALVWVETPTNPLLKIADIGAIADLAASVDALLSVDNTFATPYLQQPIALGADLVVHSLTKYLGGHSDVVGGAVITDDEELGDRLGFLQNGIGATPDPFGCFLVHRGIKTLPVRMDRHCSNAGRLVEWLSDHEYVTRVHYPGLESHPGHEIARAQMCDFGGMVSVELDVPLDVAETIVSATEVFTLAESLGGVESLIELPASMTHAAVPAADRREHGVTDGLIRLSVGLEAIEDLQADLGQAIDQGIAEMA